MFALGLKVTLQHFQLYLVILFHIGLLFSVKIELLPETLVIGQNVESKIKVFNIGSNILEY